MNLFELAERFPPCVCRLLARKDRGTHPKSSKDIADESGLSKSFVAVLARRRTWKGIPVDVATRFALACGVNLADPGSTIEYIRTRKKVHLRRANPAQRRMFQRIMTRSNADHPGALN
jgi:hypothetical protein